MVYTSTKCKKCEITSISFQPYIMLALAIPDKNHSVDIYDCLKDFSKEQQLIGENKYKCDTCRENCDATQTTYLWESPEVLIIHLKRFSSKMIGRFCQTEKISTKIKYPLKDLDLSSIYSPYNKKNEKYELRGVVQQYGSLNGGHYVACCKNSMNDKWY